MGTFNVTVEVAAGPDGPFETLDAVVDTDATFTRVPSSILQRLGVEPVQRREFITPDGNRVERSVGSVVVRIDEESSTTLAVFGESDGKTVLGSVTLATLGLGVDPERQRLIPVLAYLPSIVLAPGAEREAV